MNHRFWRTTPLLTLSLILLLAACNTNLSGTGGEDAETTWRYQTIGEVVSLDPVQAYDTASGTILENVYETLYGYADESSIRLVPRLATAHTVSSDRLTHTFTLREDVEFHSGNLLSCKDVEWSLEYGLVTANPVGAIMYLLGEQLVGTQMRGTDPGAYQAEVEFATIDQAIECPDGDDGMTVELNLTQPEPALIAILAYTSFSIIDSQFAIENGMWDGTESTWTQWIGRDLAQEFLHDHASGTGAYQLEEWAQTKVVAEAFPDYWGGAPQIDIVEVQVVSDQSARIAAIEDGSADRITINDASAVAQVSGKPGVTVHRETFWTPASVTAGFFNFQIDTTDNAYVGSGLLDGEGIPSDFFTDDSVRRAFAHLFDQQGFIDDFYDGDGTALTMALPPSFPGYNDDIEVRTLDLQAAEQNLRSAYGGLVWDSGFEFTALYNQGNTLRKAVLEDISKNLALIDQRFQMNVVGLPWSEFLSQADQRRAPLFVLGWGADYADPKNFIGPFYDGSGYYSSRTAIDIPEIQALIAQAESVTETSQRVALYEQIGEKHYDLAPLITVPTTNPVIVTRSSTDGVYYNAMLAGEFLWKDISKDSP